MNDGGVYVTVVGIRSRETIQGHCSPRALVLLPLSLVLFAVLIQHAGFLPAVAVLIFVAAAAGKKFKFKEVLVLTAILTVFATILFIFGVGLPYPLLRGF